MKRGKRRQLIGMDGKTGQAIKFSKDFRLTAIDKETGEEYEIEELCFPLGKQSGKDIAVISKDDRDVLEWMSIDDVDIVSK